MKICCDDKRVAVGVLAVAGIATYFAARKFFSAANQRYMDMSLSANRNVIRAEDISAFINPKVPLSEHFTKVKDLGAGSYGRVSLFTDKQGHEYAIKHLFHVDVETANEFANGLKLDHPNIVKIHNRVIKADGQYIIMEYIKGQELGWLEVGKEERLRLLSEMLDGYEHALSRGLIPLDLYGANVMITEQGHWKFVDLAHYADSSRPGTGSYPSAISQRSQSFPDYFDELTYMVEKVAPSEIQNKLETLKAAQKQKSHYEQMWTPEHIIHLKTYIREVRMLINESLTRG